MSENSGEGREIGLPESGRLRKWRPLELEVREKLQKRKGIKRYLSYEKKIPLGQNSLSFYRNKM